MQRGIIPATSTQSLPDLSKRDMQEATISLRIIPEDTKEIDKGALFFSVFEIKIK
jgi:hypothetical protein